MGLEEGWRRSSPQVPKGSDSKEDGARFVSVVPREQTRGNGHKLKYKKLHLKRKNFFFFFPA